MSTFSKFRNNFYIHKILKISKKKNIFISFIDLYYTYHNITPKNVIKIEQKIKKLIYYNCFHLEHFFSITKLRTAIIQIFAYEYGRLPFFFSSIFFSRIQKYIFTIGKKKFCLPRFSLRSRQFGCPEFLFFLYIKRLL